VPIERSIKVYLYDIRQEIGHIEAGMADKSVESFARDWTFRYSIQRCIEIISEATRRLPKSITDGYPDVPWRQVRDIGNVLRHEYDRVADKAIFDVIQNHLPRFKAAIEEIDARIIEPDE
jgi:uncharacterized protein with HEPN domain